MSDVIHHVTAPDTWAQAVEAGTFTESTLGRSLEEEGFIHCCDVDQLDFVLTNFYGEVPHELVLLTIDPDRLESPLVREVGNPETGEQFPHVYGPLNPSAVVATELLHPPHSRPRPQPTPFPAWGQERVSRPRGRGSRST